MSLHVVLFGVCWASSPDAYAERIVRGGRCAGELRWCGAAQCRSTRASAFGSPISVESIDEPEIGTGEVIVDVVAAPVLRYMREVVSGARNYVLELPAVPGASAIGRVRVTSPDATKLRVGDWVFCDLGQFSLTGFPLDQVNEALHHAADDATLFGVTVLHPTGRA